MVEEFLVLSQYWFELSEEEFINKEDGEMEARKSLGSLANSCQVTQGSSESLEAIFLWTQPQQHCYFLQVHQVDTRIEGSLWIDQEKGDLFYVSNPLTFNELACLSIQIYATNIEDLFVTQELKLLL